MAHATCIDGIAANWLALSLPASAYGSGPNSAPASTKPGSIRGGAIGTSRWTTSAIAVQPMREFRTIGKMDEWLRQKATHNTISVSGKCTR